MTRLKPRSKSTLSGEWWIWYPKNRQIQKSFTLVSPQRCLPHKPRIGIRKMLIAYIFPPQSPEYSETFFAMDGKNRNAKKKTHYTDISKLFSLSNDYVYYYLRLEWSCSIFTLTFVHTLHSPTGVYLLRKPVDRRAAAAVSVRCVRLYFFILNSPRVLVVWE